MAERATKINNTLCEIFNRALFVKRSIIRILITKFSNRGYPADRQYINKRGLKLTPGGPRNVNVPVTISYHQFGLTERKRNPI